MQYIDPYVSLDYLFVEQLSSTPPFLIHRVVDLSEREFSTFKTFKQVNPVHLHSETYSTDLTREAATLRAVHHPAVPTLYRDGVHEGLQFVVYRYVWGKSLLHILRELRRRDRMLSDAYAVYIGYELARVLSHIHAVRTKDFPLGVVHGHLNPHNVLISYSGRVNTVAFGHLSPMISKEHLHELDFRQISYLSPEQVSGSDFSFKADIFSFGSILYEMLTGVPPFIEKSPLKLLNRITRCNYAAASSVNPAVSRELDRLLSRCLALYSGDRFNSAEELCRALDSYLTHHHSGFRSGKITRLVKSLFNDDIVQDIRYFQTLEKRVPASARLLVKSIPKRLFDEVQEERRRAGMESALIDPDQFSAMLTGVPEPAVEEPVSVRRVQSVDREAGRKPPPSDMSFLSEEDSAIIEPTGNRDFSPRRVEDGSLTIPDAGGHDSTGGTTTPENVATADTLPSTSGPPTIPPTAGPSIGLPPSRDPDSPSGVGLVQAQDWRNALIGRHFGDYTVQGILGWGGLGAVYAAVSDVIGKEVAIKVLDPAFCHDSPMIQRFLAEAQAASVINSPHVLEVYSFGVLDERYHYLVMEKLRGATLGNSILLSRSLPPRVSYDILSQVFDVLAAAHAKGIVHGDLNPDNIYLEHRPLIEHHVKIMDFGLARFNAPGEGRSDAMGASPPSMPAYLSPEQCRGEAPTPSSDIYSLGVIIFQLFTGRLPFLKESRREMIEAHLRESPPRPSLITPMSAGFETAILWPLQKDPGRRPRTVSDFAAHFLPFLQRS